MTCCVIHDNLRSNKPLPDRGPNPVFFFGIKTNGVLSVPVSDGPYTVATTTEHGGASGRILMLCPPPPAAAQVRAAHNTRTIAISHREDFYVSLDVRPYWTDDDLQWTI